MVSGPLQACSLFIPLAHRWLLCQSRGEYPWDSTVTHSPPLLVTPEQGWQSRVVPLGLNILTTELAWDGGLVSWLLLWSLYHKSSTLCKRSTLLYNSLCQSNLPLQWSRQAPLQCTGHSSVAATVNALVSFKLLTSCYRASNWHWT